jgi:hypothetical protein
MTSPSVDAGMTHEARPAGLSIALNVSAGDAGVLASR